ncbi:MULTISPECIES: SCO2525 family SAM-dependent methyltransferase [unclassified Streptomyces]|uniref:SCO2525 family SAM-dependent methyltransferase n=1 Tax=unclassified Streptomyces TaxID=2593676 RepID=UPI00224B5DE5|nr:SCO2525 family SAM-dependent methyltransferase [Streptomyces sp. NEAU-W12]MCX2925508.1 SCO2525 family SAM-dependent methyltransferase [Streptomyces sp. NEAU-W12]
MMDRNADAPWAQFDPEVYVDLNYRTPLEVDLLIVRLMRDYFGRCFAGGVPDPMRGVDVGAGANLYPGLAMLPWCEKIVLLEYAQPNVEYLERQTSPKGYDEAWDAFWNELSEAPAYAAVEPKGRFGEIVRVERANLLDLDGQRRWDIGTMFFVADSMSECPDEFRRGVRCFMDALTEGAPFAAAFMKESVGYQVGEHRYPAYRVNEDRVRESLEPFTSELVIHDLHHMVRAGHEGIILALGRRNSEIAVP